MFLKVQSSLAISVLTRQHVRELKRGEKALIAQCATGESNEARGRRRGSSIHRVASILCFYMKFLN